MLVLLTFISFLSLIISVIAVLFLNGLQADQDSLTDLVEDIGTDVEEGRNLLGDIYDSLTTVSENLLDALDILEAPKETGADGDEDADNDKPCVKTCGFTENKYTNCVSDKEKSQIVAEYDRNLKENINEEGSVYMASTMQEPIRRAVEYQAAGRKVLNVTELAAGAIPVHQRDPACVAYVISRRGAVPEQICEGENVIAPTFQIAAHPSISYSDFNKGLVEEAAIKVADAIGKEETTNIITLLKAAVEGGAPDQIFEVEQFGPQEIKKAFAAIQQHGYVCTHILINPARFLDIQDLGRDYFDEATTREIMTCGLYGHIKTADIIATNRMYNDEVLFVSRPVAGHIDIKQDIRAIPCQRPERLRAGAVVYEEIALSVTNPYGIALLRIKEPKPAPEVQPVAVSLDPNLFPSCTTGPKIVAEKSSEVTQEKSES